MPLEPARVADSVRFGGDFELDVAAGRLQCAGRVLKLERIPMEILLLLVQQRGKLVTREQIVEKIWAKDVFLDTDNSINGAIRKVRQVLKDDPEQPRFIQTITGKGYRFLASVDDVDVAPAMPVVAPQLAPAESAGWSGRRRSAFLLAAATLFVVILFVAALGAYLRWSQSRDRSARSGGRVMLAVLPFENLTGDAGQEYFSDGMTEEMITALGSLDPNHMGVIARTSVMHYKRSPQPLAQITRELGVQYVLEGSVRRDADQVRITAQLIQMKDQTHLWARQYDRQRKDLLVLQSEIAREISGEIEVALGEHASVAPAAQVVLTPEAYESYNLYLKGQYSLNKRTVVGFREAVDYFGQATAKDASNARAYAGLADSYALIGGYSGVPQAEFLAKARAAALRALQLDDRLPEAHAALALIVQNYDHDWQGAEKEFNRAIELNPSYATAHQWYAEHLTWRGRFDEALRESERARQLDPLSLIIAADNGATLYYARQYDRAIVQFTAVREIDPGFSRARMIYFAYLQKGMFAEAVAGMQRELEKDSPWHDGLLAYAYGRAGQPKEAERFLAKLLELSRTHPVDPIVFSTAYAGAGNNEQTIAWLEKAYAQHSIGLSTLKVAPEYDALRGDPRFQDLLRRVGLAQ